MALKKSEKRLLTMFGLALFVVANLLAEGIFAKRKQAAQDGITQRSEEIAEYEALIRNEEKMGKRREWLSRRQPRFVSEEAAATDVENHIKRCAENSGVTIDSLKPTEPLEQPTYTQVAINLNVSGAAEAVTQFASLLQSREGFFAVPNITFTTDRRDPSILRCAATAARWYHRGTSTTPEAPTGDNVAASGQN